MKVSCIENFSGQSTTYDMPTESKCYYGNGKLKKTYKSNGKTATEIVYDENGKRIGSLEYRYDKEMDWMAPYNGEKIEIDLYERTKKIISILTYKNGKGTEGKFFDQDGELQNQYFYDDEGEAKEIWSFGDGGKQVLTYRDGLPYNGRIIEGGSQSTYKDGVLMETKETDLDGNIMFEKKYDEGKNVYDVKVYSGGRPKYFYTMNNDVDAPFSAEITPFDDKGKPMSKIVVKDGKIEKGVLKLKSYADAETIEYSKKGKWYLRRTYVEKELVKEEKYKSEGDYSDYFEIYEDMLRYE
jgi:MORN repeat protein